MRDLIKKIRNFVHKLPGEKLFGNHRFLPFYFLSGAGLEYTMIHWNPNGHNFYKTYIKRHVHEDAVEQLRILGELGPEEDY